MSKLLPKIVVACLLGLLLSLPASVHAFGFQEWGISVSGQTDIDINSGTVNGLGVSLNTAAPLMKGDGLRLDFRLEGSVTFFSDYANGMEVALVPGLRLYLTGLGQGKVTPFFEAGVGPSYNNLDIPELGMHFNFLSYGGLGLRLPLSGCNLDVGYRVRHISNAGMDENNHGLTSNLLHLGLVWPF